jgi:hypothetical protein
MLVSNKTIDCAALVVAMTPDVIHRCAQLSFIAVADFFLYRPSIEYAVGGVIQIIMICIRRQCEQKLVDGVDGITHAFNLVKYGGGGEIDAQ